MTYSPFVGLRPFDTNDADWFFGRDRETTALAAKLRSAGFTAVVGPSGSGKSSLVRAGVVPLLRGQGWKEIIAKPGTAPIERLARALASVEPDPQFAEARYFRHDTVMRASAFGLVRIVEALGADAPRLLLVIDQFEELFRYGDEASGARKAGMREESRAFVELLLHGASGGKGRLHVCITMRSDFFGACSSYAGLAEAISESQYLVPMPARNQLELAIRKPVKRAGAEIDEMLVQRLLVDVQEESDRLPLLQHTLRRLWEFASGDPRKMREKDYVTIGKIEGSIDRKADEVRNTIGKANAADLVTLERVMKALTDLDVRGRATRRMQKKSELLTLLQPPVFADSAAAAASLDRVIEPLADEQNSFLQLSQGEDPEVDIGHEALIRSWKQLSGPNRDFESGWLREERDDGEQWRGYVTRAREGILLSLQERQNVSKWLRRRSLGEEWSRRYGDRWEDIKAFITRSWWRGIARATAGVVCLVLATWIGWQEQGFIKAKFHQLVNVEPFKKWQIQPHVLTVADEQELQPLMTFADCADFATCPEMAVIPPGEFTIGSQSGCSWESGPPQLVRIARRFAVSKYEVTFDQWDTCIRHGSCPEASDSRFGQGDRPVINISWKDAQTYVKWLSYMTGKSYRLLSEAEWEYAARAGTTTLYYWANSEDHSTAGPGGDQCRIPIAKGIANCDQCNNGKAVDNRGTRPVGEFPPNQFGLCDTRGNVWEFTADVAHEDYVGVPPDGSVWAGPDDGQRVLRGGSWSSFVTNLTATYRFIIPSDGDTYPGVGIRIARTLVDAGPAETTPASRRGTSGRQNTCQIRRLFE